MRSTVCQAYHRLSHCPRTSDEDIHQSPGALLPVRAGRHVSDADEGLQEIDWVEVPTYVAAFDTALYESTNYFMDWRVGSFNHLRVAPDRRIQRRRNNLLRRDVINEQQHPRPQSFQRRHGRCELLLCRG